MAGFWNRRKNNMAGPPQYVQPTDTVSRPQTILMSLLMIFVAGAIIFSLFLGIKWGIDKINSDDGKKPAPISTKPVSGESTGGSTTTPGQVAGGSTATNSSTQTSGSTSSSTTSTSGSANSGSAASSTATTSSAKVVPNTGPTSTLAVFLITFIVSTFGYYAVILRRQKSTN